MCALKGVESVFHHLPSSVNSNIYALKKLKKNKNKKTFHQQAGSLVGLKGMAALCFQKQNRRTGYGGPFGVSVSFLTLRSQGTAPYPINTCRPWASKRGSGRPWCSLFLEPSPPEVPLLCLKMRFTLSCVDSSPSLSVSSLFALKHDFLLPCRCPGNCSPPSRMSLLFYIP